MRLGALLFGGLSLLAICGLTRMLAEMDEHRWIPIDDRAIQYGDLPVDDAVARLDKQIESGKAILEILIETKPGLPAYWKAGV